MKRGTNNNQLIAYLARVILVLALSIGQVLAQEKGGALVAAEDSPVQKTAMLEVRRIYLGLPSSKDSLINDPVINLAEPELFKRFLQKVMHMTEQGYRRKIVKRIFRQGGKAVKEVDTLKELVKHLKNNPQDVSFMSLEKARQTQGIKIVQILW